MELKHQLTSDGRDYQVKEYKLPLSFSEITIQISKIGNDYQILLFGGECPHIGCTVLAVPRNSLTGNGTSSSTSSVLNLTGHKDEFLCRLLAEKISAKEHSIVSCSGGFHVDHITQEQITEVYETVQHFAETWHTEY